MKCKNIKRIKKKLCSRTVLIFGLILKVNRADPDLLNSGTTFLLRPYLYLMMVTISKHKIVILSPHIIHP